MGARKGQSQWQRWRRNTPKSRIEADRAMIDIIRGVFKMAPLYGREKERGPHIYVEANRSRSRSTAKYELV